MMLGLVSKHKRGDISLELYWDLLVEKTLDYDLPSSVQRELEMYITDSDSE